MNDLHFKRIDKRRSKEYALVVSREFSLPVKTPVRPLQVVIDAWDRPMRPKIEYADHYPREGKATWRLTWRFKADKPSTIPSEDDVRDRLAEMEDAIDFGIRKCVSDAEEAARRLMVVEQAEHLARWFAKNAVSRAKAIVRYDQRLAALYAEMDAEIEVQLGGVAEDAVLAKQLDTAAYHDEPYDHVARERGMALAERFANFRPVSMFGDSRHLSVDDVYPEDAEPEDGKQTA